MSDSAECRATREIAAELALGIATGEERARALDHLAACSSCRKLVDELSDVADAFVTLGPSHEPPVGFESRVMEGLYRRPDRRRWPRVVAAVAAVAVVASLGAGSVLLATAPERELAARYRTTLEVADGEYFSAAPLRAGDGKKVGHVFGYQGSPSWIFLTVSDPGRNGRYRVVVVDRRARSIGWVDVRDGLGSWGGVLPIDLHDVDRVRLVDARESLRAAF